MDRLGGPRKILIYDSNSSESLPEGDLELCISKDDNIHYDSRYKPDFWDNKTVARFENYRGKIYIPKNMSTILCIGGNIEGIIGSPSIIRGSSDVNVIIEENSGLELIVYTNGPLRINNKLVYYGTGILESPELNFYGKADFNEYTDKYIDYLSKKKDQPIVDKGKYFETADFSKSAIKYSDIDTCMHHNLVLINKNMGIANIYYTSPFDENIPSSVRLHKVRNHYKRLQRDIQYAANMEDFNKANNLKKGMTKLKEKIIKLNEQVREEKNHQQNNDQSRKISGNIEKTLPQ